MKAHTIRYGKCLHLFLSVIWLSFVSTQDCKVNGPVQNLNVDRTGQRSFQVSWRAPEGGVECVLEYSICVHVTGMEEEFCETQNPYRTSWSSTQGVLPCTNYTVIVAAIDRNSNRSDNASVTLQTNPVSVENISLVNSTYNSISFSWDTPTENVCVLQYSLSWCFWPNSLCDKGYANVSSSTTQFNITELESCTPYSVFVTSVGPEETTSFPAGSRFYTEMLDGPGPVANLSLTAVDSVSATVAWNPPEENPSCASLYNLCISENGTDVETCIKQDGSKLQWENISPLQPCTEYRIEVTPIDFNGELTEGSSIMLLTAPSEVDNLTITDMTSQSLLIHWDVWATNSSCARLYSIRWCPHENWSDSCYENSVNVSPNTTEYNVTNLLACTNYDLTVKSLGSSIQESRNTTVTSYTDVQDFPGPVRNLATVVTYDSIFGIATLGAEWVAPEDLTCIQYFRVCNTKLESGEETCVQVDRSVTQLSIGTPLDYCSYFNLVITSLDGNDKSYGEAAAQVATSPGLVTNFTMIDSGYKYLTVSWDISMPTDSCVEEYEISWCLSSSQECPSRPYYTIPANMTVLNITGLNTCMTYNVFVTAIGNGGLGSLESNIFAKSGGGDNLAAVSNLAVSSIGTNMAQVTWERPTDLEACVDSYVVCLKNDVTQEVMCDSQTGSYTQWYSGPTLSACINYTVQVQAQDYSNKMGGNATLTFFTAPDYVAYMYLVSKSAHSALVSWQASENRLCLHQYTLCWKIRDDSNEDYDCDVTPSTLDEYNITRLDACTDYTVLVRSVGYNNLTSRDYSIHFKTEFAEPSLMSDIAITSSTAHSMSIQWETITNSSACVSLYIVCFGDIGSDEQICTSQSTFYSMWYSGDVLAACSTYNVSLRAQYQDQQFYLGDIVHMTGPEEVQNLTLKSRTISSLQISWEIPQDNLECVEQQIISWCYINPYDEYWQTCSPTSNTSVIVDTDISIYNITDLLECSQYSITVTSITAKSIMARNVTTKLYTVSHTPEAITNLTFYSNQSLIELEWEASATTLSCVKGYNVCWQVVNEIEETCTLVKETFTTLEDLAENSQYTITVSTIGSDGSESPGVHILVNLT